MSTTTSLALPKALFSLVVAASVLFHQVSGFVVLPASAVTVRSSATATARSTTLASSAASPEQPSNDDCRFTEFANLEPVKETKVRRKRREQDANNAEQFCEFGDKLWDLRSNLDTLSKRLLDAVNEGEQAVEEQTRERLREVEKRDPELVYMLELLEMEQAATEGRGEDAAKHRSKALAARSCLPQFNLEGLWIGKYGSHGYEMVNITYVGDTLIAFKVTGDKNVPRGEITFQSDLHPLRYNNGPAQQNEPLQPIALTDKAASKWGTRQLPRYGGLGRVAEEGFENEQWMDGQLIIIGDEYFSFAWIPIENQIFFGRPSPELVLKMLRDSGQSDLRTAGQAFDAPPGVEDAVDVQKDFATRCLEKTDEYEDDYADGDAFGCIWESPAMEECYFE